MDEIKMDNQQERIFAIGWLVGILEGEGWFSLIVRPSYNKKNEFLKPLVGVANTNPILIEKAHSILNELGVPHHISRRKFNTTKWKDSIKIGIVGLKRVNKLLEIILPYMTSKKRQAEILKEFIDYRVQKPYHLAYTDFEWKLHSELKMLNQKGNPQRLHAEHESDDIVRASQRCEEVVEKSYYDNKTV